MCFCFYKKFAVFLKNKQFAILRVCVLGQAVDAAAGNDYHLALLRESSSKGFPASLGVHIRQNGAQRVTRKEAA
jgi:hypothetical protein